MQNTLQTDSKISLNPHYWHTLKST